LPVASALREHVLAQHPDCTTLPEKRFMVAQRDIMMAPSFTKEEEMDRRRCSG
jgi:hypothetical protein